MNKTKKRGSIATLLLFCLLAVSLVIPQGVFADGATITASDLTGLKDAVANATDGQETLITLDADMTMDETIVIPAGKQIVLRSEGAVTLTKADTLKTPMFSVESGASLTVQDALTMNANGVGRHIESKGTLVLAGGTLTGGRTGAVKVSGATGTLTLSGTRIADNVVTLSNNGAVLIADGATGTMTGGSIENTALQTSQAGSLAIFDATFTMEDGTISGATTTNWLTGGGVYVRGDDTNDTHFTMNGGLITGNQGSRGGGVRVAGGESEYRNQPHTYFTMNGGTITGNTATGRGEDRGQGAGGGVYITYAGHFIMNGGEISNNVAHNGGGVATFDYFTSYYGATIEEWRQIRPAEFTMNYGVITGNKANYVPYSTYGGVGGGVYVASDCVTLLAGEISNNTAASQGGGIYIGTQPYTLQLTRTVVTENRANTLGGGIWLCPTGTLRVLIDDGGAIYDNEATAKDGNRAKASGDDLTVLSGRSHAVTVTERMLGGGLAKWYEDGTNDNKYQLGYATNASEADRYQADNPGDAYSFRDATDICMSFKNITTEGSKENAEEMAALWITGNTANRGGGIGSNGSIVMGTDDSTRDITVEKKWDLVPGSTKELPSSISVHLYANGRYTGDSGELIAQGDGTYSTYTFKNLATNVDYTVLEYPELEGFTASYEYTNIAGTDDILATITNTEEKPEPPVPNTPGEPPEPPIPSTGGEEPSTGDQQEMGLWIVLLVSAALTTGGLTLRRKLTK